MEIGLENLFVDIGFKGLIKFLQKAVAIIIYW